MDARDLEPKETTPASRKLGRDDAEQLVGSARKIVVAKSGKVKRFSGGDDEAVDALLGPTGNLRSPTVRAGKTLLVGFDEGAWSEVFG